MDDFSFTFTERIEYDAPERRVRPRFATNRAGRVRPAGADSWAKGVPVVACDVSERGMLLASSHTDGVSLRKGASIEVKLALGDRMAVLSARVAWVSMMPEAWLAGLELSVEDTPEDSRAAFEAWRRDAAEAAARA